MPTCKGLELNFANNFITLLLQKVAHFTLLKGKSNHKSPTRKQDSNGHYRHYYVVDSVCNFVLMQFDLIGQFFRAGGSRKLMFFYQEVAVSKSFLFR